MLIFRGGCGLDEVIRCFAELAREMLWLETGGMGIGMGMGSGFTLWEGLRSDGEMGGEEERGKCVFHKMIECDESIITSI